MTAFVTLLFITKIPINFKITNFPVYLCLLVTVISATSKDRMTTNIIFVGATPINY